MRHLCLHVINDGQTEPTCTNVVYRIHIPGHIHVGYIKYLSEGAISAFMEPQVHARDDRVNELAKRYIRYTYCERFLKMYL
jgi:hypothetical protein